MIKYKIYLICFLIFQYLIFTMICQFDNYLIANMNSKLSPPQPKQILTWINHRIRTHMKRVKTLSQLANGAAYLIILWQQYPKLINPQKIILNPEADYEIAHNLKSLAYVFQDLGAEFPFEISKLTNKDEENLQIATYLYREYRYTRYERTSKDQKNSQTIIHIAPPEKKIPPILSKAPHQTQANVMMSRIQQKSLLKFISSKQSKPLKKSIIFSFYSSLNRKTTYGEINIPLTVTNKIQIQKSVRPLYKQYAKQFFNTVGNAMIQFLKSKQRQDKFKFPQTILNTLYNKPRKITWSIIQSLFKGWRSFDELVSIKKQFSKLLGSHLLMEIMPKCYIQLKKQKHILFLIKYLVEIQKIPFINFQEQSMFGIQSSTTEEMKNQATKCKLESMSQFIDEDYKNKQLNKSQQSETRQQSDITNRIRDLQDHQILECWTDHSTVLLAIQYKYVFKMRSLLKEAVPHNWPKICFKVGFLFPKMQKDTKQSIDVIQLIISQNIYKNLVNLFDNTKNGHHNQSKLKNIIKIMLQLKHQSILKLFIALYDTIIVEISNLPLESIKQPTQRFAIIREIVSKLEKYGQSIDQYLYKTFGITNNAADTVELLNITVYCLIAELNCFQFNEYYCQAFNFANNDAEDSSQSEE